MERANGIATGVTLLKARMRGARSKRGAPPERGTRFFGPEDRAALIRLAYVVVGLHGVAAVLLLIAYVVGSYELPT